MSQGIYEDVKPQVFIGTATLFFAIINVLKLPGLLRANLLDIQQIIGILWVIPMIPLGVWIGRKLIERINPKTFERLMLGMLFVAGLLLLLPPM